MIYIPGTYFLTMSILYFCSEVPTGGDALLSQELGARGDGLGQRHLNARRQPGTLGRLLWQEIHPAQTVLFVSQHVHGPHRRSHAY